MKSRSFEEEEGRGRRSARALRSSPLVLRSFSVESRKVAHSTLNQGLREGNEQSREKGESACARERVKKRSPSENSERGREGGGIKLTLSSAVSFSSTRWVGIPLLILVSR